MFFIIAVLIVCCLIIKIRTNYPSVTPVTWGKMSTQNPVPESCLTLFSGKYNNHRINVHTRADSGVCEICVRTRWRIVDLVVNERSSAIQYSIKYYSLFACIVYTAQETVLPAMHVVGRYIVWAHSAKISAKTKQTSNDIFNARIEVEVAYIIRMN